MSGIFVLWLLDSPPSPLPWRILRRGARRRRDGVVIRTGTAKIYFIFTPTKPVDVRQWLLLIVLLLFFSAHAETQNHPLSAQAQQQFEQGKFEEAVTSYTQLIGEFPEAKESYYNRGLCLYELKQFDKALADFDKALAIDSTLKNAKLLRALSLEGNGNVKQAVIEYEKLSEGDTKYTLLNKRIKSYRLSVILSKNWYYMIAMMLVVILLMAVVAKSFSYRKG